LDALEFFEAASRDDNSDDDSERKKRILKHIVTIILQYHILPEQLSAAELLKNNTYATNLVLPKQEFDERALRLRIIPKLLPVPPGAFWVNWYSSVVHSDISASNGMFVAI
jgi:hypothetical protein